MAGEAKAPPPKFPAIYASHGGYYYIVMDKDRYVTIQVDGNLTYNNAGSGINWNDAAFKRIKSVTIEDGAF